MGHAGPGTRKQVNLGRIQLDAVGMPHIVTRPAQILGILTGPTPELRLAIGNILFVFRKVGV